MVAITGIVAGLLFPNLPHYQDAYHKILQMEWEDEHVLTLLQQQVKNHITNVQLALWIDSVALPRLQQANSGLREVNTIAPSQRPLADAFLGCNEMEQQVLLSLDRMAKGKAKASASVLSESAKRYRACQMQATNLKNHPAQP
jgi:hypothetical protein